MVGERPTLPSDLQIQDTGRQTCCHTHRACELKAEGKLFKMIKNHQGGRRDDGCKGANISTQWWVTVVKMSWNPLVFRNPLQLKYRNSTPHTSNSTWPDLEVV